MLRFGWLFAAASVFGAAGAAVTSCGGDDDGTVSPVVGGDASAYDGGGRPDSGVSADSAPTGCAPANVSMFEPHWSRPSPLHQGACSRAQLDAFTTSCDGTKKYSAACLAFQTAAENAACASCIFGAPNAPADAGTPALLVGGKGQLVVNHAGCLANATGDYAPAGCPAALLAEVECELAACGVNCPVTADAADEDFLACVKATSTDECKTYADKVTACIAIVTKDGGALPRDCLEASEAEIVELFCGQGPADAGTDQ